MAGIWHSRLVSYMAVACVEAGVSAYGVHVRVPQR